MKIPQKFIDELKESLPEFMYHKQGSEIGMFIHKVIDALVEKYNKGEK